jgi:PRTRC genetic system protein C
MALHVQTLSRKFVFSNNDEQIELPEVNPSLSPQQVMDFYTNTYPELTTATVEGPNIDGAGVAVYKFTSQIGIKG